MASRYFALIPAAGHSRRMGAPKLLLPLRGQPLVAHPIAAWKKSQVERIVVVARPGDDELIGLLRSLASDRAIDVVVPEIPPPDMKASLQAGLDHLRNTSAPADNDAFLVAPADLPHLSTEIIDRLIDHHRANPRDVILTPMISGKRGHPVLLPWPLAAEVFRLPADEGLKAIVERLQASELPCDDLAAERADPFGDVDTPAEYEEMRKVEG
jgi:molybdenum cofactor cytidylyltransferase